MLPVDIREIMKTRILICLAVFFFFSGTQCSTGKKGNEKTQTTSFVPHEPDTLVNRKPAVAGTFYPGKHEDLLIVLDHLFSEASPNLGMGHVAALISPHAGYVFSGRTAASAYNQLSRTIKYDNVFIIGTSHYMNFGGAALYCNGNFATPLGIARVNISLGRQLIEHNPAVFISSPDVHAPEHSIEVQIPFLQYLYGDQLQIVPILLGTEKPAICKKIAEALRPYFNEHNLFIISTDFSHYPDYQTAYRVDEQTAKAITANSATHFLNTVDNLERQGIPNLATSICGRTSVLTLLDITESTAGTHYRRINYMNSGDIPDGDKSRVVGYNAIEVTLEKPDTSKIADNQYSMTQSEKDQLLHIARSTIKNYLETKKVISLDSKDFPEKLLTHSGAFVTLNKNGELRGCIGRFTADVPLYQVIQEMAISAATKDYRFSPLSVDELGQTHIEISVLTPMHKIESISEITLGRHGIYIKKGNLAGTFLPQVATETGWSLDEFLGHCARDKAGIGWNGWKDAEIYVYEAYVFGEE
jgi:MEMO1 family protein